MARGERETDVGERVARGAVLEFRRKLCVDERESVEAFLSQVIGHRAATMQLDIQCARYLSQHVVKDGILACRSKRPPVVRRFGESRCGELISGALRDIRKVC